MTEEKGSWGEILRTPYTATTVTLCLGVALYAFNTFLVATALPTAVQELDGLALISWSLTVYLVFAIMSGASAALLQRRFSAQLALTAAAVVFLLGSVVASVAVTMPQVLVGRALQGIGQGVVAALVSLLTIQLYPLRLVPKVFGIQAVVWAVAGFGGPVLAGLLTQHISWRAAFLVNVPLAAIFIALVLWVVPRAAPEPGRFSLPLTRLAIIGVGIMLVSLASIAHEVSVSAALLLGAAVLLACAVLLDRRGRTRLMPRDAFSPRTIVGNGLWVVLLMPMANAASTVYLVLLLQTLWGFTPTLAGAIGAIMALSWSGAAIPIANVVSARRRRLAVCAGPALLTLGFVGTMLAFRHDLLVVLVAAQVAVGSGFGVTWAFLNQTVMVAAGDAERDRASGLLPTVQSAGYAVGGAVTGLVANLAGFTRATTQDDVILAVMVVFGVAAALSVGAFVAAIRTTSLAARAANA
ncbi:MAG: MFS transporter [Alphaproteobacteria bacterium]|nr:MFS transporter [Alphaproteobacteria bacterium]MCW5742703.1 MFS transporter [Alphaproteobacteria bacterium]